MRGAEGRSAAAAFAEGLFRSIADDAGGFDVALDMIPKWSPSWPRPQGRSLLPVVARAGKDGMVDFSEWSRLLGAGRFPGAHPLRSWFRLLSKLCTGDLRVSLVDLMQALCNTSALIPLYSQFLREVSRRLYKSANDASQRPPQKGQRLTCGFQNGGVGGSDAEKAYAMARYGEAAKFATEGFQCISVASDKASIRGLSLTKACFVMPTNTCVVLPPMVVLGGIVGSDLLGNNPNPTD